MFLRQRADQDAVPASYRRRRRRWRRALLSLGIVAGAFAVLSARLFVWPQEGLPPRVSAIIMLAGPGPRLPVALQLARETRAPVLVVSRGSHGYGGPCPLPVPGIRLICFEPVPADTRGEAEYAARLAARYSWSSVVLVTTRGQDTRARMLMARCFAGPVYVVTAALPWDDWPYQIAYGWGSLVKALTLRRSC